MKKLRKYGIILTTIITIFTSSLIVTKAASPTVQVSWTKQLAWDYPYSSSTRTALLYNLFINTTDTCTGTITIDFSGMSANDKQYIDSGIWYSEGCRVTYNSSTHKLTISINSQQFCTVSCLTLNHGTYTGVDLSYTISRNLTIDTDNELTTKLNDILNEFGDLNTYAESIKNDIHSLYLLIVDMTGDVQDINDHMTTALTRLSTIITSLGTTNTGITTIQNLINTNTQALATLLTAVNNIDTQIDTISWNNFEPTYNFGGCDSTSGTWTEKTTNSSNSNTYVGFNVTEAMNAYGQYIIYMRIPAYITNNTTFYQIRYNGGLIDMSDYVYLKKQRQFTDVYIYIPYNYNSSPNKFVLTNVTYVYPTYTNNSYIKYIPSTDIEYWKLLQYFEQYKYQTKQLNLTQELIDIVSQLTSSNSTETTENITNFNTNMEIVNNIENNISADFGNSKTIFDFNESNKWSFDEDLRTPTNSLNSVFTATINAITPADTWLSLILLCAVLLAILG